MAIRLEVISIVPDTRAKVKQKQFSQLGLKNHIKEVTLVDVYTLDKKFTSKELLEITHLLVYFVTQKGSFQKPLSPKEFTWAIEVGFLPGVTDNIASTAQEMIEDKLQAKFKNGEGVYTSTVTFVDGKIAEEDVERIVSSLYNPVIQRAKIKSFSQFKKDCGMGVDVPRVTLSAYPKADTVNLDVSDEELTIIGKAGIVNKDGTRRGPLALDLSYMKTICTYFKKKGRNPTDIELESIAQTWSEHCKHTIFADPIDDIKEGLYKKYIKSATEEIRKKKGKNDFCVSVFKDNSGSIEFDDTYLVTHKVETHNSPSALDPFGGAITGIVGVNRDAIGFGLGAKPIVNTYGFCFADPKDESPLYKGKNFTQKMLSPNRIMAGVIAGVNSGGNCSGIPTPLGFVFFNKRYKGKPLVFVGTVGLIPKKTGQKKMYLKKAMPGDYIVMVGGRVGLDGIHGATFSSEALDTGSPATAVQIGDPITQKKLSDVLVKEARDLGLYTSITDNGAGGLSCSVAEMAKECGGAVVELEKVPLKYPGLAPWQTWISESQERMTLAVPKNKWKPFSNLMRRRGVEATVIGRFTNSGKCIVKSLGKTIMDIDMEFLHNGLPPRPMKSTFSRQTYEEPQLPTETNITGYFQKTLERPNIASFEFISMQYDHEVQAGSVIKPLQGRGRVNGEATVVRPRLDSSYGIVISQSLYPTYSDIDSYHMAASSIDGAIRNAVAAGANPDRIALIDNFCWCSSTEPERLGQLKRAVKACYDFSIAYSAPFISGKDSMFNDFKGYDEKGNPVKISIPPTLLVSSIGVIKDVAKTVSIDCKFPGDLVYILGDTHDELGASEYFSLLSESQKQMAIGNRVPEVNAVKNLKLYKAFYQCIEKGLISSAISVGRGGLAVSLAKTALGGLLGLEISLKKLPGTVSRDDFALFSESAGRLLVTINPLNKKKFEEIVTGNSFSLLGKAVKKPHIIIANKKGKPIVKLPLDDAMKSYKKTFKGM